ncbi:hypothetical protein GC163_06280 [bacterium]|nr:hypothetical protein [bacterium]
MQHVYGVMVTMTTYGTWLRGDARSWVDDGRIYPPDPILEAADRNRLKYPPFCFLPEQLMCVGQSIGESLCRRLHQHILALTVQTWHVHLVVSDSVSPIADVVKCAKDAVRYRLCMGRPIWTAGYDKRFSFDEPTLHNRISYVERHNLAQGWSARPWPFVVPS